MGCCSSQEPPPSYSSLKTRTFSLSSQLAVTSELQLKKSFNSHIEDLKSLDSFYTTILNSGKNSTSAFKECLQSLPFYFSQKNFDCFTDEDNNQSCPECLIDFNKQNEIPLILTCSHTVCKNCCEQLFNVNGNIPCSLNCIPTTEHPGSLKINSSILEIAEAKEKGLYCFDHSEICSELCIKCVKVVCDKCAYLHEKHRFVKLNSELFRSEVLNWGKNLKIYENQIEENIMKVKSHKNRFLTLRQAIIENLGQFCTQMIDSTDIVRAGFYKSASDQIENIEYFVSTINECMPIKLINLYNSMIKREIEKSNELLASLQYLPLSEQLKELSKVPLKPKNSVTSPDTKSWEGLENQIRHMINYQELLIAITAIKLA